MLSSLRYKAIMESSGCSVNLPGLGGFFWKKRSWHFKQYGEHLGTCQEENCLQDVLTILYRNYFSWVHFQYQGLTEPYWWWGMGWWMRGERGRRRHDCMISPAQGATNGPLMALVLLILVLVLLLLWLLLWKQTFPHKACFPYLWKSIWADLEKTRPFCHVISLHDYSSQVWQSVSAYL